MLGSRQNLKAAFVSALLLLPSAAWSWTGTTDSYGFSVDTSSRNDVISFWQAIYVKSEGFQNRIAWTGNYTGLAAGSEGTISTAFVTDVERRANCIRALCGAPADLRFNTGATVNILAGDTYAPPISTTKSAAAQRSALMVVRTGVTGSGNGLSHDPPTTCIGWTTAAWNANSKGNLAYAFYGPRAIDAYFREDVTGVSAWNLDVGHRRWLLYLRSTDFATGDTPGLRPENNSNTAMPPSNCLYVVPKTSELDTTVAPQFVAYPGRGFFPAPLNSPFWSLSYPGANFSAATVSMKAQDNSAVTTAIVSRRSGFGDNAIVWQVPTSVAAKSFSGDVTYQVTVSGISGAGVPTSFAYSITLINPERLTDLPAVAGPATPMLAGADYTFSRSADSEAMEVGFFQAVDSGWVEGAENSPSPQVIDLTDLNYDLRASSAGFFRTGSKAFRLSLPTAYEPSIGGVPDQIFEIDRELIPSASASLNLYFRRGYMAASTSLVIESSADGGVSWTTRATIAGVTTNSPDPAFSALAVPLPVSAVPLRVRFRLTYSGGSLYTVGARPTETNGIYFDDISTTNCLTLEKRGAVETVSPATTVTFDSTTAGQALAGGQTWLLRLRSKFGGKWFPYGNSLVVTPIGPLGISGNTRPPDTGATYTFLPEIAATSYQVDVARLTSSSWLEGAEPSPSPKVLDQTGAYALLSTKSYKSGKNSFRLALDGDSDSLDSFEIDRSLIASSSSALNFQVKRGRMLKTNFLHAEVSTDAGATWTSLWNQAGLAPLLTSTVVDSAFAAKSIPLSSYAGQEIRVRFVFRKDPAVQTIPAASRTDIGVWVDDVTVTNAPEIVSRSLTDLPADPQSFTLDAAKASPGLLAGVTYRLRIRAMAGATPGPWGQALSVVPVYSVPIVNWLEGAENSPSPNVLDQSGAYDLISIKYKKTGARAFRLALDSTTDSVDAFAVTRCIIPSPGSALNFQVKRGKMLNTNFLNAEISTDAGTTWTSLWNLPGLGTSLTSTTVDKAFIGYSIPLPTYAAQEIFVRFAIRKEPAAGTITAASKTDAGVWIDDISVNVAGLGTTVLGGGAPLAPAFASVVLPSGFEQWQQQFPSLLGQSFDSDSDHDGTPDGVEYAFSLDPTQPQASTDAVLLELAQARLKLSRPLPLVRDGITYGAEWTEDLATWSTSGVKVTTTGGEAVASAPLGSGRRFMRWRITKP